MDKSYVITAMGKITVDMSYFIMTIEHVIVDKSYVIDNRKCNFGQVIRYNNNGKGTC